MSSCTRCNNVVTKYKRQSTDNELLSIHTERQIYLPKSREKKKTRDELLKRLSALRNSGGGVLLIHVNGTRAGDRCLKYFDEFVGNIVTRLLEPGEVYANTYRRQWLQDLLDDSAGFIHIRVAAVKGVATVDFNTKLGKDYENVIPTTQQLLTVRSHILKATDPVLRNLPPDKQQLHEDIHIQLKGFPPPHTLTEAIQKDATDFVEYLWNKLKLKDSITSMSKIPEGGSFYFGIGEKSTPETDTYKTIIPDVHGFKLKVGEGEFKKTLKSKLQDCVLWGRSENTFTDVPSDLIAIAFHRKPFDPRKCVLEVAVKCVEGVVFCDSHGPRTYVIEKGQICRMKEDNWSEGILKTHTILRC